MVRVQPARGPVYYMIDSNGDGRLDQEQGRRVARCTSSSTAGSRRRAFFRLGGARACVAPSVRARLRPGPPRTTAPGPCALPARSGSARPRRRRPGAARAAAPRRARKRCARSAAIASGVPSATITRSPAWRLEKNVSRTTSTPISISSHACRRLRARGEDLRPRVLVADDVYRLEVCLHVVDGDDEHPHAAGACRAQQVWPRRVAVIDLVAETAHELDLLGAVLDRHEGNAAAPTAGGRRSGRSARSPRSAPAAARPRCVGSDASSVFGCAGSRRVMRDQQQRRQRHRSADDRHQPVAQRRLEQAGALRLVEHHECEFAAQRQHAAQQQGLACRQPARPQADREQHHELQRQQQRRRLPRSCRGSAATRARSTLMPTAMKNRPSSRPLKGSICALELVPELRIGEQHAGEERAQSHASVPPAASAMHCRARPAARRR